MRESINTLIVRHWSYDDWHPEVLPPGRNNLGNITGQIGSGSSRPARAFPGTSAPCLDDLLGAIDLVRYIVAAGSKGLPPL
jgi:hypothetical protein